MGTANNFNKIAANPAAFVLKWLAARRNTVNVLRTLWATSAQVVK